MPQEGFEPVILASERSQTHALHRAASEIGHQPNTWPKYKLCAKVHDGYTAHALLLNAGMDAMKLPKCIFMLKFVI